MSEPFDRALRAAARRSRAAGVCPDAAMLASYADNGLSADERRQVEAHAADCATCLEHLGLLGAVSLERDTPEPSRSWFANWGWLVPVATAVLVVVVWTRLPQQERAPATPAPASQTVARERESVAAPVDTASQDKAADQEPRIAAKVGQTARPARPAETKADELAALERRDVARQKVGGTPTAVASEPPVAPPVQAQEAAAKKSEARPLAGSTGNVASPAPTPPQEFADAVKEEVRVAEVQRRREADLLKSARAASAPLVVSASPKESYRVVGNRIELSEDGGVTWRAVTSPLPWTFVAAACAPGGSCWFGGVEGGMYRRRRDEIAFSSLPVKARVVAISPDGLQTAVVTVEGGQRFRTTDGGSTWLPIP